MKTPKREQYYRTQKAAVYEDSEGVCPNHTAYEHARWKRKNRVAQLKRTIELLRIENTHLRIELAEALTEVYSGYYKGVEVGFSQGFKHGSRELIKLEMLNAEYRKDSEV